MTYFELWTERSENIENQAFYNAYIHQYYDLEKKAYDLILSAYPDNVEYLSGTARTLAEKLGFPLDWMDIFVGFIDGINSSLKTEIDCAKIEDDTPIKLDIDYERLYINMREAKADWLYKLSSWNNVFSQDERGALTMQFRDAKIVRSDKVGRNDPCPCGSGKKYKQCCINK